MDIFGKSIPPVDLEIVNDNTEPNDMGYGLYSYAVTNMLHRNSPIPVPSKVCRVTTTSLANIPFHKNTAALTLYLHLHSQYRLLY